MLTADFDFDLPSELVAQQPADPRDSARLMVLRRRDQTIEHRHFWELPELLVPRDLLIVNDTRVMAARLHGVRPDTGGAVEALLVRPLTDTRWQVLFRPARQAVAGRKFVFDAHDGPLGAHALWRADGVVELEFERPFDPAHGGFCAVAAVHQGLPWRPGALPDRFTAVPRVVRPLRPRGCTSPLRYWNVSRNRCVAYGDHARSGPRDVQACDDSGPARPPTPFGTRDAAACCRRGDCSARRPPAAATLRSARQSYARWSMSHANEAASSPLKAGPPSKSFLATDSTWSTVLLTNFHLPKSTLLMLVSAFAGTEFVREAYRQAVAERYRFYSFGDAMLLLP